MEEKKLIEAAVTAMETAYCPYSGFFVGAALLAQSGKVYTGCNMENSAYPAGSCAERGAFSTAISAGEREFTAIAIVGGKNRHITDFCRPCGVCRQMMSEFCKPDFLVLLFDGSKTKRYSFGQLLPEAFGGIKE